MVLFNNYSKRQKKVVISKERSDWEILRFLTEFTLNEVNVLGMTGIQWKLIYYVYYMLPLLYLFDGMSKIIFCYHEFPTARALFTDGITDGH